MARLIVRAQSGTIRRWGPASRSKPRPKIPKELRLRVFERDGHKCVVCGMTAEQSARMLGRPLTMDHRIPRIRGGKDTFENLQTMCSPCNREKGDR